MPLRAQKSELINIDLLSDNSKRALVSLSLEGITPSPALLADLQLLDSGQLSEEEFLKRAIAQAKPKA